LAESVTLEELAKKIGAGKLSQVLLPVQLLVGNWPYLQLDENKLADVRHGKKIKIPEMAGGWVRVLNSGNRLCAVGIVETVDQENWLKPKKVFGMDGLS
jgi:tRNA U55 pseudouridine synthase TruB